MYKRQGELLNVVESTKLLGIFITSDLKWKKNVHHIVTKAKSRLWMMRRIRELGGSSQDLLLVYQLQIRCLTELGCPAWNGALTVKDVQNLERIQKLAVKIILGGDYVSYNEALETLNLETLQERRKSLSLSFAKKTLKNDKYKKWFTPVSRSSRSNTKFTNSTDFIQQNQFISHTARTTAYQNSPILYLTQLLNDNP